jgi:hypothetical protein
VLHPERVPSPDQPGKHLDQDSKKKTNFQIEHDQDVVQGSPDEVHMGQKLI